MSQRSALIAAAIATAEVSEPPRPSVVMRPVSLLMPWKPETTATSLRSLKRLTISLPSMSRMRAEPCASEVLIGICQPCHERAWMPSRLQRDREQARRHLLARCDHGVVLARVVQRRGFRGPADELVGFAGHGGNHDGNLVPRVDLALHVLRNVADALDVGDGCSAEFHDETAHDVRRDLPYCLDFRHAAQKPSAGAKRRVYIPMRGGDRNRFRPAFGVVRPRAGGGSQGNEA